jgi:hypothetical protein
MLSISKWIVEDKLKSEGGFQYLGMKIGSAKPVIAVKILTHTICLRR